MRRLHHGHHPASPATCASADVGADRAEVDPGFQRAASRLSSVEICQAIGTSASSHRPRFGRACAILPARRGQIPPTLAASSGRSPAASSRRTTRRARRRCRGGQRRRAGRIGSNGRAAGSATRVVVPFKQRRPRRRWSARRAPSRAAAPRRRALMRAAGPPHPRRVSRSARCGSASASAPRSASRARPSASTSHRQVAQCEDLLQPTARQLVPIEAAADHPRCARARPMSTSGYVAPDVDRPAVTAPRDADRSAPPTQSRAAPG